MPRDRDADLAEAQRLSLEALMGLSEANRLLEESKRLSEEAASRLNEIRQRADAGLGDDRAAAEQMLSDAQVLEMQAKARTDESNALRARAQELRKYTGPMSWAIVSAIMGGLAGLAVGPGAGFFGILLYGGLGLWLHGAFGIGLLILFSVSIITLCGITEAWRSGRLPSLTAFAALILLQLGGIIAVCAYILHSIRSDQTPPGHGAIPQILLGLILSGSAAVLALSWGHQRFNNPFTRKEVRVFLCGVVGVGLLLAVLGVVLRVIDR